MKTVSKTISTKTRYEFTRDEVINALIAAGKLPLYTPGDAEVYMRVPGGGDWSHCNLDLDSYPLIVVTEEIKTEES